MQKGGREGEEERRQIAYDNPGKTMREKIIPVGTKRKHLQAGYDIP